jgi:hypothetical protein
VWTPLNGESHNIAAHQSRIMKVNNQPNSAGVFHPKLPFRRRDFFEGARTILWRWPCRGLPTSLPCRDSLDSFNWTKHSGIPLRKGHVMTHVFIVVCVAGNKQYLLWFWFVCFFLSPRGGETLILCSICRDNPTIKYNSASAVVITAPRRPPPSSYSSPSFHTIRSEAHPGLGFLTRRHQKQKK